MTVSGIATVTTTASNTASEFDFTLPSTAGFAPASATQYDILGTANVVESGSSTNQASGVYADTTQKKPEIRFQRARRAAQPLSGQSSTKRSSPHIAGWPFRPSWPAMWWSTTCAGSMRAAAFAERVRRHIPTRARRGTRPEQHSRQGSNQSSIHRE